VQEGGSLFPEDTIKDYAADKKSLEGVLFIRKTRGGFT